MGRDRWMDDGLGLGAQPINRNKLCEFWVTFEVMIVERYKGQRCQKAIKNSLRAFSIGPTIY